MAHGLCTVIMQILRAQQSPFTSIAWKRAALTFYLISITVLNVRKCLEGHKSDQNLNTWMFQKHYYIFVSLVTGPIYPTRMNL